MARDYYGYEEYKNSHPLNPSNQSNFGASVSRGPWLDSYGHKDKPDVWWNKTGQSNRGFEDAMQDLHAGHDYIDSLDDSDPRKKWKEALVQNAPRKDILEAHAKIERLGNDIRTSRKRTSEFHGGHADGRQ